MTVLWAPANKIASIAKKQVVVSVAGWGNTVLFLLVLKLHQISVCQLPRTGGSGVNQVNQGHAPVVERVALQGSQQLRFAKDR